MYATRSQTEDATKLEYTAYNAQPTQHLSQPQGFLTEGDPLRDFGGHAKEESTLFSVTSQPPQHPQQPQQSSQQQQQQQQQQHTQQQQQQSQTQSQQQVEETVPPDNPTLADYNQSTSKGHEILSQVLMHNTTTVLYFFQN